MSLFIMFLYLTLNVEIKLYKTAPLMLIDVDVSFLLRALCSLVLLGVQKTINNLRKTQ